MSALSDDEDPPAMAPPPTVPAHEVPPEPLMDSFRSAETEPPFPPPPGLPGSLMATEQAKSTEPAPEAIADVVLAKLELFLEPHLKNIFGKLGELSIRVTAVEAGVRMSLEGQDSLARTLGGHGTTLTIIKNGMLKLDQDVTNLSQGVASQVQHEVTKAFDALRTIEQLGELERAGT